MQQAITELCRILAEGRPSIDHVQSVVQREVGAIDGPLISAHALDMAQVLPGAGRDVLAGVLGGGWAAENEHAVGGVADARVLGAVEDVPAAVEGV